MRAIAAIDIGTTGAKAAVITLDGQVLADAFREYGCTYPRPNWVEQDVDEVVTAAFDAIKEAIKKSGVDSWDIASIAASTQRTCSIFLDDEQRVMTMISWQDGRTVDELHEIDRLVGRAEYYRITGLPLNTTWIATKMLWMRKNRPDIWRRTRRVVQLQDYLLKQLGADEYYVDIPDAVLYGLWDTDHFTWSETLLRALSIDPALLPIPTKCATPVGAVGALAAGRTGLREGTMICVGAGDQNAAAVGAGVVDASTASVSIGTGGMAIRLLDRPYRDPAGNICVGAHAVYGKWQIEGYQTGAAGVFRWFRDTIAEWEKREAQREGKNVYARLDEMIAGTPPGADGLLFLPFFASSAAPHWDADARGTMLGLTLAHTRSHMARAFIEGITMEQKDILHSMRDIGDAPKRIRLTGGASKSDLWCQIQADMYGVPVQTLQVPDAALIGAAIFAGVGARLFDDIEQGAARMVRPLKIYRPREKNARLYDDMYAVYSRAYRALADAGVFADIARLQKEENVL